MGLDGVELIMAYEETFDVRFTDEDAVRMLTPRDVIEFVASRVPSTTDAVCLEQRAFYTYVDGDYYASILTSLEWIYPRLSERGIILVDDYCDRDRNPRAWDRLPGVKKTCDDFLADKPERISVLVGTGDLAFGLLRKQ